MKKKIVLTAVAAVLSAALTGVCMIMFIPGVKLQFFKWIFEDTERKMLSQIIDTSDLVIDKDIAYIDDGDRGHLLDIYRPVDADEDIPVVFNIHGGGLFASYKEVNLKYCYEWARRGYAVVSISYRRIPETTLWHQINDCMSALRYIDDNRERLNINPDKCFLTGDSAGALLSYYIASINSSRELQDDFGIDGCCVDFKAMGLISIMLETDRHDLMDFITTYISDKNNEGKAYYPYLFDASEMLEKATLPPIYLITGDEDMIQGETMKFDSLLSAHGIKHELKNYPRGDIHRLDHVFAAKYPEWTESQEAIDLMSNYFSQNS